MGVRDGVAKTILAQLIIKGALGCKTLADWWYFSFPGRRREGGVLEGV